jgi:MADS-box transcription factor
LELSVFFLFFLTTQIICSSTGFSAKMSQGQYTDGSPDDAPQRKSTRRRTTLAKEDSFGEDAPDSPIEDEEDSTDEGGKKKERKGRRKISISFIEDKSRRHITFSKRKAGIMKKVRSIRRFGLFLNEGPVSLRRNDDSLTNRHITNT